MEAQWHEGSAVLVNVAASFNKSEMTLNEKVLAEIVLHYYTGDSLVIKDSLEELSMMFNDASYRGPSYESLKLASEYAPTYSFIYNYKGSETYMEDFILMLGTDPDPDIVSRFRALTPTHGDDLLPIFNLKGERTDEDLVMSSLMTRYWTNFAKFGNPSPEEDTALPRWMPFNMAQVRVIIRIRYCILYSNKEKSKAPETDRQNKFCDTDMRQVWNLLTILIRSP